jgi:hypothetical protein
MDESFYYLLLAIPATCAFWFLCAKLVRILANWLTCRRLRHYRHRTSPEVGASGTEPQKKPHSKIIRGFDSPELFTDDTLQRIRALQKRIAECDKEIDSWKNKL